MTGAELRRARRILGLTQVALAARLRITVRCIYGWERGDRPIPAKYALDTVLLDLAHETRRNRMEAS